MPTRQERTDKTAREMFLEHAAAYFDDMKTAAQNAPHGQIFDHAEAFAVQHGRELIRQSLEDLLQEQIDEHEKLFYRYSVARQRSVQSAKQKNGTEAIETKKESARSAR